MGSERGVCGSVDAVGVLIKHRPNAFAIESTGNYHLYLDLTLYPISSRVNLECIMHRSAKFHFMTRAEGEWKLLR